MNEPGKVLIVDDEETMRDSCRLTLAKEGCQVFLAKDGAEGLERIRSEKPDLVLVDLKMPGVDGIQVLQELKEIDQTIVAVVITGYATIDTAIDAFKRGAYDFLPKPFSPEELRIIVRRGLERRRLHLEAVALQNEKQRMQKVFVAMVSHQLRSPLVTVQQGLEVLTTGIAGELSAQQAKLLERMKVQVGRLLVMIRDWLDLARLESGRLAESLEPTSLFQVLTEVVDAFRPQAESRRIALRVLGPGPATVRGDREALKQMLGNIVDNAIKYSCEGGSVDVSVEESGSGVAVKVTDTGVGMERSEIPLIFDEFYRAGSGRDRNEAGTGLGLPIARRIAEAHSGSISVQSTPGRGSTFTVSLPKP